jgi:hypothetical protein
LEDIIARKPGMNRVRSGTLSGCGIIFEMNTRGGTTFALGWHAAAPTWNVASIGAPEETSAAYLAIHFAQNLRA